MSSNNIAPGPALEEPIMNIKDTGILLFRPETGTRWTAEALKIASSLGFDETGGTILVDMKKTHRVALRMWMEYAYPNVMKSDKWKVAREKLIFKQISNEYDRIEAEARTNMLSALPWGAKLMKHQVEDVPLISRRNDNLLAHDQGMGKTISATSKSYIIGADKTIVICPAVAKFNWYYQLIETWGISPYLFTVIDSKKSRRSLGEKFILVNYDMLNKHKDYLVYACRGYKKIHVIVDECHYIKEPSTQRWKAAHHVIKTLKDAGIDVHVTLMSGTPISNKVVDLFGYFKLLGFNLGGSKAEFEDEFTHMNMGEVDKSERWRVRNAETLRLRMSNFMIRRRKKDTLTLPPKIMTKSFYELEEYAALYKDVINKAETNNEAFAAEKCIHHLNIVSALSKMKGIIEYAESIIESGEKVVIFTGYKKPMQALFEHFGDRAVYVHGLVNSEEKIRRAREFQSNPEKMVFVGQTKSAGIAIDLFEAKTAIYCDIPLTASEIMQSQDRIYRIGQTSGVNIVFTISKNTIDEVLYDLVAAKAEDMATVVDGQEEQEFKTAAENILQLAIKKYKNAGKPDKSDEMFDVPAAAAESKKGNGPSLFR